MGEKICLPVYLMAGIGRGRDGGVTKGKQEKFGQFRIIVKVFQ
jgi:hypothetical protein